MPDGKRLVTAGQDGTARVWDVGSGQQLLTLAGNTSTVTSISASPDGSRIASSGYDGTLKIWDAAPGRELLTLPAHSDIVWDVAYSPNGKSLASVSADGTAKLWDVATSWDGTAKLWDLTQGRELLTIPDQWTGVAFSPDGKSIFTSGLDGYVRRMVFCASQCHLSAFTNRFDVHPIA